MSTQATVALIEQGESALIRASQSGDIQAAETLFGRYRRSLLRTALRVTRNMEDAEDALQDGFLSAYRNLTNFQGRCQFCTWLTRIVINAALMQRRRSKVRRVTSLEDCGHETEYKLTGHFTDGSLDPEQLCAVMELNSVLTLALEQLSPLLRAAFILREVRGYSTREAARRLGVAENTFKIRLWRARHQMARCIKTRLERATRKPAKTGARVAACGQPLLVAGDT